MICGIVQRLLVICCAVFAVFISSGCGDFSSANSGSAGDSALRRSDVETRPIGWHLVGPPRGNVVRIGSSVGWCYGAPKPRIAEVRARERRNVVILTALLANFPKRKGTCADLGMGVVKSVELPEELGDRALYDGSVAPPAKRWPRPSSD